MFYPCFWIFIFCQWKLSTYKLMTLAFIAKYVNPEDRSEIVPKIPLRYIFNTQGFLFLPWVSFYGANIFIAYIFDATQNSLFKLANIQLPISRSETSLPSIQLRKTTYRGLISWAWQKFEFGHADILQPYSMNVFRIEILDFSFACILHKIKPPR